MRAVPYRCVERTLPLLIHLKSKLKPEPGALWNRALRPYAHREGDYVPGSRWEAALQAMLNWNLLGRQTVLSFHYNHLDHRDHRDHREGGNEVAMR